MAEKDPASEKLELSLFRRKRKRSSDTSGEPEKSAEAPTEPVTPAPGGGDAPTEVAPAVPAEDDPATGATARIPAVTGEQPGAGGGSSSVTQPPAQPAEEPTGASATGTVAEPDPPASPASPAAERGGRRAPGSRVAEKSSRQSSMRARVPSLAAQVAVLVVGAAVGLAAVVLTFASLKACELVTGTDSCGGPGLFVLLAVVVLMILGGSAALTLFGVPESGGISFLGVATFVAVCLVALLPNLLEPWMIIVAPILCALSFALAHWIVTRFDEDILEDEQHELHDVR